ncbi:MAG TPA: restriction endonuclease subunit S [Thermoanaerobaculia bacterium]
MVVRGMILARSFPVACTGRSVTINQDMKALTVREPLATPFFLIVLRALEAHVLASVERSSHGTCKLRTEVLENLIVPLPPLAEQKRIVAKVDELMALCDRLEAQQKERDTRHAALALASLTRFADAPTPANLTFLFHKSYAIPPADLRKSILTLAVRGGLVPFDSSQKQTVGDHIEFLNGFAFKSEWFKSTGTRLCRNANVNHGFLHWHEPAFVDETIANEFQRFALAEGDIVLSLDRPLISTGLKVARVRASDLPCLLLQRVAKVIRKHDELELAYFFLWLNSSQFVDSIDPGRSNGVPHISTRQVERLQFVLPPVTEQRRIVAKVDQLMALVDELETQLAASRTTAAKLLDAVVSELTA